MINIVLAIFPCLVFGYITVAAEWIDMQDWAGKEVPCAVQVALEQIKRRN